jgi:hypothetical protein
MNYKVFRKRPCYHFVEKVISATERRFQTKTQKIKMKKLTTLAAIILIGFPICVNANGTGGAGPACSTFNIQGYQCKQSGAVYIDAQGTDFIITAVPCNSGVIPGTTTTVNCPVVASSPSE